MALGFTTYRGSDNVRFGFYWNRKEWSAQIIPKEGGDLKGTPEVRYLRLPLLAVLFLAPVMGAAYAFFLPFIGIAMVLMYLAGGLRGLFRTTPPAIEARAEVVTPQAAQEAEAAEAPAFKKAA